MEKKEGKERESIEEGRRRRERLFIGFFVLFFLEFVMMIGVCWFGNYIFNSDMVIIGNNVEFVWFIIMIFGLFIVICENNINNSYCLVYSIIYYL